MINVISELFKCSFKAQMVVCLQHIKVLDGRKLEVFPASDKSKLHFDLHWFKNRLPTVVVKVRENENSYFSFCL